MVDERIPESVRLAELKGDCTDIVVKKDVCFDLLYLGHRSSITGPQSTINAIDPHRNGKPVNILRVCGWNPEDPKSEPR